MFNRLPNSITKFPLFLIALIFTLQSCQVDEEPSASPILEEDIIEAIQGAILPNAGGLITQINATAMRAMTANELGCSIQRDSTLNQALDSRNSFNYSWKLENTCDLNGSPFELTSKFEGNRRYLNEKLSANEKLSSNIRISGFSEGASEFELNLISELEGSYRAGNDIFDGYVGKISMVGINVKVNKTLQEISSGTITILFNGASISGKFFNFNGQITFNGNNRASFTFTNGGTYPINW